MADNRARLSGDSLSRLAQRFELWSQVSPETSRTLQHHCCAAIADLAVQDEFIHWLSTQSGFESERLQLALLQLAQCAPFQPWETLKPYRTDAEDLKFGVYGLFLCRGRKDVENVKRVVAKFVPHRTATDQQQEVKIRPINFTADQDTQAAMTQAVKAVSHLIKHPYGLLTAYVFAGDFLFLALYRALRILWRRKQIQQKLDQSEIYLYVDGLSGERVAGPSLGATVVAAVLIALIKTVAWEQSQRASGFWTTFAKRCLSRFSDVAFTGAIIGDDGAIGTVNGIAEKVLAMEAHPDIKRGMLPTANRTGIESRSVRLFGVGSLQQVLRQLVPFRRTWLLINICLALASITGVIGPDLVDLWQPQPELAKVRVGEEIYYTEYVLKQDLPVTNPLPRITLYFNHARDDGRTYVQISAIRQDGYGFRGECLQAAEEIDDWHPFLILRVINGQVTFDYQHQFSAGKQVILSVVIRRHGKVLWQQGRDVAALPITLEVQ